MHCSDKTRDLLIERLEDEYDEYLERLINVNESTDPILPMGAVSPGDEDYPFFRDGNGNEIEVKKGRNGEPNKKGAPELLFYWGD
ncbi:MAG: hypothetical protein K2G25_01755, partial [Oscillospiraceae bacterium]|nr:hypothetical protein [Oscillospiraceae bacterium]